MGNPKKGGERMFATETQDATLAPVIEALHGVYGELSAHVALTTGEALPPALFVVKRDARAWGHITTGTAWATEREALDEDYPYGLTAMSMGAPMTKTVTHGFHEIMVSGENLSRGGRAVFGTVAHEATHALNIVRGVRDVDSNGRHNRKFADLAEHMFGLTIEQHRTIGWSLTTVGDDCHRRWRECIARLDDAIRAVAHHGQAQGFGGLPTGGFGIFGGAPAPKGRNKNLLKAVCGCGDSIRASRTRLDKGVFCGDCREAFQAV